MLPDTFYRNNHMSAPLEAYLHDCDSFDEFEKKYSDEFLNEDTRIGDYLGDLLAQYDAKASVVSNQAGLHHSYVGNIIRKVNKKPSRDSLICICLALGATEKELEYLLKYAGYAPLYVRNKRDVIIWFGLIKKESIETIDQNLTSRGLPALLKDA